MTTSNTHRQGKADGYLRPVSPAAMFIVDVANTMNVGPAQSVLLEVADSLAYSWDDKHVSACVATAEARHKKLKVSRELRRLHRNLELDE